MEIINEIFNESGFKRYISNYHITNTSYFERECKEYLLNLHDKHFKPPVDITDKWQLKRMMMSHSVCFDLCEDCIWNRQIIRNRIKRFTRDKYIKVNYQN